MDILIVEDNDELAGLLCDFLRAQHYTVSIAENAEKALSLLDTCGAKLVVLDIMLPGADGFAVCKQIRAQSNTPILIVSARTGQEDKLTGLHLGADGGIRGKNRSTAIYASIRSTGQYAKTAAPLS